jgi:FkbM family methyltransferase
LFISYAQNFEDVMLHRALAGVESGFYIDVGAADPVEMSVTKAFYDAGWRGVNIEPGRHYFERLRDARPGDVNLDVALAETAGSRAFHEVADTGLSTLHADIASTHRREGHRVTARPVRLMTLAEVCEAYAKADIHFLKIDVEGAEAEVLAGADFQRFRPWIVLLEATEPLTTIESAPWEPMLLDAGYVFVWFDGLNRFYVAQEHHAALAPHFRLPPNSFDQFKLYDPATADAVRTLAEHANEIAMLEREMQHLRGMQSIVESRSVDLESQRDAQQKALDVAKEAIQVRDDRVHILEAHVKLVDATLANALKTMEQQEADLRARVALLTGSKETLDRLSLTLHWDDGPRALKPVLPLARILRRLTGRGQPPAPTGQNR